MMNKCTKILCLVGLCLVVALPAFAQKPQWVGNTPTEKNGTYKFVEIVSMGASVSAARSNALSELAQDEQLAHAVQVKVETGLLTKIDQVIKNGEMDEKIKEDLVVKIDVKGNSYRLQAAKIDEYVAGKKYGEVELHTLFMVALSDNPILDRTYLTTSYGATPVALSIIPGFGQWYKGSKKKAITLFASEAVAAAGIIVCDNNRASYIKKSKEQPKFAKEYGSKADQWETGRNVCIGIAAGIWLYNMVDAIAAKGARRVIVKRTDGSGLSMSPFAMPDGGAGVSFAYRF